MNIVSYNFADPARLPGEQEQRLTAWLRSACALANKGWSKEFLYQVQGRFQGVASARPAEALAALPETVLAYPVAVGERLITLLAFPRPLVLTLVCGLIGDRGDQLHADRELTVVEESLFEYFLQRLWFPAWKETMPYHPPVNQEGEGAPRWEIRQRLTNPRWSKLFAKQERLVRCTLVVQGPFGEQECWWLTPGKDLFPLLGIASVAVEATPVAGPKLESVVKEIPVDVTVLLGSVDLPLSQLSRLSPGDVIILNQRVWEPLVAQVGGLTKLQGWAGRAGSLQAFQVQSIQDE